VDWQHIKEVAPAQKLGIDANPKDDNLYIWEIEVSDFDPKTDPLAQDMQRRRIKSIILQGFCFLCDSYQLCG